MRLRNGGGEGNWVGMRRKMSKILDKVKDM